MFARVQVGLTRDELLDMTPGYFQAMCEGHRNKIRHQEILFAQVAAMVANTGFRGFEEPLKVLDFMLTKNPEDELEEPKAPKKTRQQVANGIRALFEGWTR